MCIEKVNTEKERVEFEGRVMIGFGDTEKARSDRKVCPGQSFFIKIRTRSFPDRFKIAADVM